MQMALRFAAAMVFVAVAGCANENTTPRDSVVVSVSAYGPDNFGLHKHGVGASYDVRDTDSRTPLAFPRWICVHVTLPTLRVHLGMG